MPTAALPSTASTESTTSTTTTTTTTVAAAALAEYEQRLQLYNYALHIERFRCPVMPQHGGGSTTIGAMAAVAAMAATTPQSSSQQTSNSTATAPLLPQQYKFNQHMQRYLTLRSFLPCPAANAGATSSTALRLFAQEEPKPQHSYIGLIAMAILSSTESKLVLSDIYQYILDNYAYFRTRGPGWRNSIRHNLSLNDCFVKSGRSANGKGHYWSIHPANLEDFRKGDFRRRKAQRKVRRHMGLTVDDGADSPSPPATPSIQTQQQHIVGLAAPTNLTHYATTRIQHAPHHQVMLAQQQQQQQQHQQTSARIVEYYSQHLAATFEQHHHHHHHHHHSQQTNHQHQHLQQQRPHLVAMAEMFNLQQQQQRQHFAENQQINTNNNNNNNNCNKIIEMTNPIKQTRKRQFDVASLLAPDTNVQQQSEYHNNNDSNKNNNDDDQNIKNDDIHVEDYEVDEELYDDDDDDVDEVIKLKSADKTAVKTQKDDSDECDFMIDVVAHDDDDDYMDDEHDMHDDDVDDDDAKIATNAVAELLRRQQQQQQQQFNRCYRGRYIAAKTQNHQPKHDERYT